MRVSGANKFRWVFKVRIIRINHNLSNSGYKLFFNTSNSESICDMSQHEAHGPLGIGYHHIKRYGRKNRKRILRSKQKVPYLGSIAMGYNKIIIRISLNDL